MSRLTECAVCKANAELTLRQGGLTHWKCPRCGTYELVNCPIFTFDSLEPPERARVSSWIRSRGECQIREVDLPQILAARPPCLTDRANKVLLHLVSLHIKIGDAFYLSGEELDQLCSIGWCENSGELSFILESFLATQQEYIRFHDTTFGWHIVVTPRGWAHVESLQSANPQSKTGFIAMWFAPQVNDTWGAIAQGIELAGYQPLRIDQREHNNQIDDEIIAAIRSSRFVVADFTGHRGGVYFEAGFAKGLGLEVIWLCRKDELEKTHFDTRQYNFIVWEPNNLPDLTKRLKDRIEATLGRGV